MSAPPARLYGRRKGKRLRPGQQALLAELLPRLAVLLPGPAEPLDPASLFAPPPAAVWLEIGFGGGEHLAAQAEAHPEIGLIGCEPFINGVAKLLGAIEAEGLRNIRIHPDDARPLLAALRPGSLARVFALFPDPWPKTRHHKRRLIAPETLDLLARAMADNAELRLATDEPDLAAWMREMAGGHPDFEGPAEGPGGLAARPADWPPTRYEAKALARGAACRYFLFRRRPRAAATESPGAAKNLEKP